MMVMVNMTVKIIIQLSEKSYYNVGRLMMMTMKKRKKKKGGDDDDDVVGGGGEGR